MGNPMVQVTCSHVVEQWAVGDMNSTPSICSPHEKNCKQACHPSVPRISTLEGLATAGLFADAVAPMGTVEEGR
jgi:hypothetical protein